MSIFKKSESFFFLKFLAKLLQKHQFLGLSKNPFNLVHSRLSLIQSPKNSSNKYIVIFQYLYNMIFALIFGLKFGFFRLNMSKAAWETYSESLTIILNHIKPSKNMFIVFGGVFFLWDEFLLNLLCLVKITEIGHKNQGLSNFLCSPCSCSYTSLFF